MTIDQMRLFLREGIRIERQKWKASAVAMRIAQYEPAEFKEALDD